MNGLTKIASRTSVAALALTVGLSMADIRSANAQACDPPGAAMIEGSGSIIPEVITQAANTMTSMMSDFSSFIGPVVGSINALGTIGNIAGGCTDLTSCMQMYFSQLGATNTNTSTMNASVTAKGNDYLATNQYALQLQGAQAQLAVENGVGTGAAGGGGAANSLAYQNNNLCVTTTLASGASEASYEADGNTVSHQAAAPCVLGQSCPDTTPNGGQNPSLSTVTTVNLLYSNAARFAGYDGTNTAQTHNRDIDPAYLDTDSDLPMGGQEPIPASRHQNGRPLIVILETTPMQ